jgi:ABC-type transporter Mla MlaB component
VSGDQRNTEDAMSENTIAACRVSLAGDWSISGIAEQFPLLTSYLCQLVSIPPKQEPSLADTDLPEVDLAGVTALDACGCQLLACFAHALHNNGISLRIRNIPADFIAKIQLLGFGREFNLSH